jgi:hypothetical protein
VSHLKEHSQIPSPMRPPLIFAPSQKLSHDPEHSRSLPNPIQTKSQVHSPSVNSGITAPESVESTQFTNKVVIDPSVTEKT